MTRRLEIRGKAGRETGEAGDRTLRHVRGLDPWWEPSFGTGPGTPGVYRLVPLLTCMCCCSLSACRQAQVQVLDPATRQSRLPKRSSTFQPTLVTRLHDLYFLCAAPALLVLRNSLKVSNPPQTQYSHRVTAYPLLTSLDQHPFLVSSLFAFCQFLLQFCLCSHQSFQPHASALLRAVPHALKTYRIDAPAAAQRPIGTQLRGTSIIAIPKILQDAFIYHRPQSI